MIEEAEYRERNDKYGSDVTTTERAELSIRINNPTDFDKDLLRSLLIDFLEKLK